MNEIFYDVAKIVICPFCHADLSVSEKKLNGFAMTLHRR